MVSPAVSHRNWERTYALCVFVMDGKEKQAEKMGFTNQLETLLNFAESAESLHDEIEAVREGDFEHSKLSVPYYYSIYPDKQQRKHRPTVSEEIVDRLNQTVQSEFSSLPGDTLGFGDRLDLFLDQIETYHKHLGCYVREIEGAKA